MEKVSYINKDNLLIARENMGLSTVEVSKRLTKTEKDIVREWEVGNSNPSWPQLRSLSKLYNVSELLLASKQTLEKYKIIPDYRVGQDGKSDLGVKKLVNLTIKRQNWLEKNLKENGGRKNKLVGLGKDISNPKYLAELIKKELEINFDELRKSSGISGRKKLLDYLINKAETKGVFIGKTISYHRISVRDMRGLFISNDYCPYIVLNKKDAISAQIFSLIHELAHLFRKTEAISNSLDFRSSNRDIDPEEVFCNRVSAELLLPIEDFTQNVYSREDIATLSEKYKVSKIFVFYRLKDLRKISPHEVDSIEQEIRLETESNIAKKKLKDKEKEGGDYVNSMRDSNGSLFNKYVLSSYQGQEIGYVEASKLLCFSVEQV